MTVQTLDKAICLIDDDLLNDIYVIPVSKRNNKTKYLSVAAGLILVLSVILAFIKSNNKPYIETTETSSLNYFGGVEDESVSIGTGDIIFRGEAFCNDELAEYIEKNKYDFVGAIACEYETFDQEYRILKKGYYHVTLGEKIYLDLNIVTVPICVGDEIVGDVTVIKKDGEISYSIATRSNGYKNLNKAFKENKGSELAFFYVNNFTETIIAESGSVYVLRSGISVGLDENIDYYKKYKTKYNAFSYEMLTDPNNYISVIPYPEERITSSQNEVTNNNKDLIEINTVVVPTTALNQTDITIDDILSCEIKSVEWGNSYDYMMGNGYKLMNENDIKNVIALMNGIKYSVADGYYEEKYGAMWHIKFNFINGDYATLVIVDQSFFIETSEGISNYYIDETDNTIKIIYYLANLK